MTPALFERFQNLVSRRTGLHLRPRDEEAVQATLAARTNALRLAGAAEYCSLLESGHAPADREWPELAARLTNRESYFFRDLGQMAVLRDRILPELIERNRKRRTLRLLSAGCSTGEEPYTLAILLDQLVPPGEEWQVIIRGTDLNAEALAVAERGIYSAWSFRASEPALRQRYFQATGAGWEIAPSIRRKVTFSQSNLTYDPLPDPGAGLDDMDLILCRNVFIYFARDAIAPVVSKLARTLRTGGYLMTGHAEIDSQDAAGLNPRSYPGSLVYQRSHQAAVINHSVPLQPAGRPVTAPASLPQPPKHATKLIAHGDPGSQEPGEPALPDTARALYARGEYGALIERLEPLVQRQPDDTAALYLLAQAYTNQGRQELAVSACRRASEQNPLAVGPYLVLAALADDQSEPEEAKRLLKKVIYLSPTCAAAYVQLAAHYTREGEPARASTMWAAAHGLLRALPTDAAVLPWDGPLAGELLLHVEAQLTDGD
ncbi:MAG: methyltransferase, CheR-type [Armatimonadetes bacterium]|jgi:chemotaxis protein methyltransferase CheR|nr:methyltransferase, CheR-type [Armatimonadota bacterium]